MNIVIFGAGAIGSLFGSMLSRNNDVLLIGRKTHVNAIKKNGLKIKGKTNTKIIINAETTVNKVDFSPDLVILTVKAYDTLQAIKKAKKIVGKNTTFLSLQNGLDNIEKIEKYVISKRIIAGTTTYSAYFNEPGIIEYTGNGTTIIGDLSGKKTNQVKEISSVFNKVGIKTYVSNNIIKEIWFKAIINSSINPITTLLNCKNGYLLENPILEKLVERICKESTDIANAAGIDVNSKIMINKTKKVIRDTSENYSSMLQSYMKGKKTEIDSINGKFANIGKKYEKEKFINELLVDSIKY